MMNALLSPVFLPLNAPLKLTLTLSASHDGLLRLTRHALLLLLLLLFALGLLMLLLLLFALGLLMLLLLLFALGLLMLLLLLFALGLLRPFLMMKIGFGPCHSHATSMLISRDTTPANRCAKSTMLPL